VFSFSQSDPDPRDVMVTGIGAVTPLAIGAEDSWQRLLSGQRGGRFLNAADIDHFDQLQTLLKRTPGGAPVDHQQILKIVTNAVQADAHWRDVLKHFGDDELNRLIMVAALEAIHDADLSSTPLSGDRVGCVIGTSKASLRAMEREVAAPQADSQLSAGHWNNAFLPDAPLRCVQQLIRAKGPTLCPVAACASGLISVIQGGAMIRSGECDVCITGSADASLRASVLAAFHRLGVTSKYYDPSTACRPFDSDRDGFVIGEGAGVIVLESRANAMARSANTYGQLTGGGWLTDCKGMTQIDSSGTVVTELLQRIQHNAERPDLISLHGTGTTTNDLAETHGVATAFPTSTPPCFGVKGAIGHLLGAAGSVELIFTLLAMRDNVVPATTNFQTREDNCRANVCSTPVSTEVQNAIKLSLGFGGHVAALGMKRN